ncbi:hypothetical protein T06_12670 [Trichinella sp. T6]|nr:hypothetical protein T06_12670 [Trichinella sp. T6]
MIRKRSWMNMEGEESLDSCKRAGFVDFIIFAAIWVHFSCQSNEIQRKATEQPTEITDKLESEITFTGAAVMNQMPELSD